MRDAVDKAASLKAKQQTGAFNKAYGSAIRKLRREKGLHQSDVEGLTARQMGRIESGERATLSALQKLAGSYGMSVNEYMDELARRLTTDR
jgi:transcriptional regulator with XRE-family HTH domain